MVRREMGVERVTDEEKWGGGNGPDGISLGVLGREIGTEII